MKFLEVLCPRKLRWRSDTVLIVAGEPTPAWTFGLATMSASGYFNYKGYSIWMAGSLWVRAALVLSRVILRGLVKDKWLASRKALPNTTSPSALKDREAAGVGITLPAFRSAQHRGRIPRALWRSASVSFLFFSERT
jgi:hypothetical protein